jgi:ferredoxin-NADP reductase
VPGWAGHRAGQHLDVRLTAEDGYTAERSYSIATADGEPVAITVERLDDGEVSPYLTGELRAGDQLELRGPIGRWFVWDTGDGGPLMLVAGGSGIVPLRAILRHRQRSGSDVPVRLLYSSRTLAPVSRHCPALRFGSIIRTLSPPRRVSLRGPGLPGRAGPGW